MLLRRGRVVLVQRPVLSTPSWTLSSRKEEEEEEEEEEDCIIDAVEEDFLDDDFDAEKKTFKKRNETQSFFAQRKTRRPRGRRRRRRTTTTTTTPFFKNERATEKVQTVFMDALFATGSLADAARSPARGVPPGGETTAETRRSAALSGGTKRWIHSETL